MSQPPEDRRPMPWEPPDPASGADEPTVPWTPPDAAPPPSDPSDGPAAPVDAAAPVEPEPPDAGASPDTAPPVVPDAADTATPESPLISWTPSGGTTDPTASGVIAANAAGTAGAAGPAGAAGVPPGSPVVAGAAITGWQAPDAGAPDAPVSGYVMAGVGIRIVAWFIDVMLLAMALVVGLIVVAAAAPSVVEDPTTVNLLSAILVTGLTFLYFVGLWTSSGGATVGMRLLALRIVRATDGGTLDIGPAIIRWVAFGYVFTVLTVLPGVSIVSNWLLTGWTIVLLLTTAMSAVNQGIHDRWAGSAIVRRADARTSAALVGCLAIALVLLVLVILLPILALIAVAPQLEEILSEVGQSI